MDSLDNALDGLDIGTENLEDTKNELVEAGKNCDINIDNSGNERNAKKIFYGITHEDRFLATQMNIVPKVYMDASFAEQKIKENIKKQYEKTKGLYRVYKFNDYIGLCLGILSSIRMKMLPERSYIIGAPNGFGKSSFVNECLITLLKHNCNVAPYISLWELAQLRVADEQRIMNPYIHPKTQEQALREKEAKSNCYNYTNPNVNKGILKTPEVVTGQFSYSEYINADCLFVGFTDVASKDIESHALYQLLNIRGIKGLPTIVMISTSLEPYENDRILKEQVWDEILTYNEKQNCYDRVFHVSCYKAKNIGLNNNGEKVDSTNGIVE